MDEREQRRKVKHRLNVLRHAEEVTQNVALTCRYFGITRTTFYKWRNRYEEFGADGLRDRSSAPHYSATATPADVAGKIIHLRSHYHFGPQKISMYLARYHEVKISPSGVWRILKKVGMNRLPASQRYKPHNKRWHRYEKPQPGHRLQIDVKFIEPLAGSRNKHYQFTAIATAPDSESCGSTIAAAKPQRSASWTTCSRSSPSRCTRSRPTTAPSSNPDSTGTSSIRASSTPTPGQTRQGSMARSSAHIASTRKSSTGSSMVKSSTTPTCSTSSSNNGRTTTTSTGHMELSTAKPRMRDSGRRPTRPCKPPPSVAHLAPRRPLAETDNTDPIGRSAVPRKLGQAAKSLLV